MAGSTPGPAVALPALQAACSRALDRWATLAEPYRSAARMAARARGQRHIVQALGEGVPVGIGHLAVEKLVQRAARRLAKIQRR
mgnify:CR=1 FL=1